MGRSESEGRTVALLLGEGAALDGKDKYSRTALMYAKDSNSWETVALMEQRVEK